ncbi:hypothetical protein GCM10020254_08350 [Streptomyces goshikiensis]
MRLVSLINAEFGGELGVAAVLEHPTIAGQAALLKRAPGAAGGSADLVTMRGRGAPDPAVPRPSRRRWG